MEGHWIKTILTVFGVLFAIGGAASAFLQAKWLYGQRKILREILDALQTIRDDDTKKGIISNPVAPSPKAQGLRHGALLAPTFGP